MARQPRFVMLLVAVGSAPGLFGIALLSERDQRLTIMVSSLLALYLQLLATFRTLDLIGAMPAGYRRAEATQGRYPSAFLGSLVTTVGIILGVIALVAPGLLLLALWGVWMPALAAERLSVLDAMRRSWRLARPRLGAMLRLVLAMIGMFAVVIVAQGAAMLLFGNANIAVALLFEPITRTALIASAVTWAAAYGTLTSSPA